MTPRSLIRNPVANMRCECKASENPPRSLIRDRSSIMDTRVGGYPKSGGRKNPHMGISWGPKKLIWVYSFIYRLGRLRPSQDFGCFFGSR